ncbi:MAG TPA: biotin--[acetyl-CoA-carboxylase] ligase [Anaerolineaceae bacterium]|nr:biotin--[acetyl-CoA-carboxylase] ligase [Anaerolineaceae bacterium]
MDETRLRNALRGLPLAEIRAMESTGSTNDDALTWAERGAPDGALLLANTQTAGRGRFGRRWISPPGAALAFSLVLRPTPDEAARMAYFSALGALAVCQALYQDYSLPAKIKWPNDVLIEGRKVCGLLVETVWQEQTPQAVVIGIGLNVQRAAVPPPEQTSFPATSLEDRLGSPPERWNVLAGILKALFAWRPRLVSAEFRPAWENALAFRGEVVRLDPPSAPSIYGTLQGIDEDGSLRLLKQDGQIVSIPAGEIHLRPISPQAER